MRSANVVFPDPEFPKIATLCITSYRGAQRDRDKPRQGGLANTPRLYPNGAVGFIDWLGDVATLPLRLNGFKSNTKVMGFIADDKKRRKFT